MLGNQLLAFCFVYVLKLYVFFFLSGFQILHIGFPSGHYGTSIQDPVSHPGWRQQRQREDEDGQWRVGVSQG